METRLSNTATNGEGSCYLTLHFLERGNMRSAACMGPSRSPSHGNTYVAGILALLTS